MPATELLFRNPAFGRFFAARACSFVGDGIAAVALILLVQGRHGTGVAVGALLLAQLDLTSPRLVFIVAGAGLIAVCALAAPTLRSSRAHAVSQSPSGRRQP